MSRIVNRPIKVIVRHDQPHTLIDGGDQHNVAEILDRWTESGAWWNQGPSRHVYRVITDEEYMFDVTLLRLNFPSTSKNGVVCYLRENHGKNRGVHLTGYINCENASYINGAVSFWFRVRCAYFNGEFSSLGWHTIYLTA